MANYSLPHFGQIDLTNLDEYYNVEIDFDGQKIEVDLNFEEKSIDSKQMDTVKKFMGKIPDYDKKNKKYIERDYADEDGDTVKMYVEHHLEEIDKTELAGLVDFNNKSVSPEKQLVKALSLVRVGFYPHDDDEFAIFDYSISKKLTNYLVVISTDKNGKLEDMTMES